MYLARITFGQAPARKSAREENREAAESYLVELIRYGQISEYDLIIAGSMLVAFTKVARPDALADRYNASSAKELLEKVVRLFGRLPEIEILEDDFQKRFPTWQKPSFLFLYSFSGRGVSPICCGDTRRSIPIYLFPISDDTRLAILTWARSYSLYDDIWWNSGPLEKPAYKLMVDPHSELSIEGRRLCAEIERVTQKPTYYYLFRFWGRVHGEDVRPCPSCGKQWNMIDGSIQNKDREPAFRFRCERCRLIATIASVSYDERLACIGEFKKPKTG